MAMNNLFIFVEGIDDKKFVNEVLANLFYKKSIIVIPITYQIKKNNDINKQIIRCAKSKECSYVFFSDLDSHSYPCITSRKNARVNEYNALNQDNILIVCEEIESWYLAGLDNHLDQFKDFDIGDNTEGITKEKLSEMIDKSSFENKVDFFAEVCKTYNLELAMKRNKSFKYFLSKFNLID
ncbi:MAG: DUF4276 family protein [Methanobrevibacter sp.]|uniref:hypothetical protein n=1 Tax=Methanobrevibacter sp. TaxID=66852 RepID=UPI00318321A8|nr:DUF4276 family protein [Methanobrevibacter sp.]